MKLKADPTRLDLPKTGIFIKAIKDGRLQTCDIAHLDRESLFFFLKAENGNNLFAENTVMSLLDHKFFTAEEAEALMERKVTTVISG